MIQQVIEIDEEIFYIDIDQIQNQNLNSLDIRCPICLNVYLDPVSCDSCLNHFCKRCHQLKKSLKCPLCNQYSSSKKAFPLLLQLLSDLKIKCSYFSKGCTEVVNYDGYEKHYRACEYQDVQCRLSDGREFCNVVKLKKDIKYHRDYECIFRFSNCCHCNKQICHFKLQDHESICEEAIINCKKCSLAIKVKDETLHLDVCEKNTDKCLYCFNEKPIRELKIHQKECPLRPVHCIGCSQRQTLSVYYIHQMKCPKFPIICQYCEKKMCREKLESHKFEDCLTYIKQEYQAKYEILEKRTMNLEQKLKYNQDGYKFSNRYKDNDIFLNYTKKIAFVKHSETKKKDRFVLFNKPVINNEEIWRFKIKQINSAWFAVGITNYSVLYTQNKFQSLGHGAYLVSSNGTMYNNHRQDLNSKDSDFRIYTGDILEIQINKEDEILSIINITQNLSSEIDIELHNMEFYGCVCLRTSSDEVEIID